MSLKISFIFFTEILGEQSERLQKCSPKIEKKLAKDFGTKAYTIRLHPVAFLNINFIFLYGQKYSLVYIIGLAKKTSKSFFFKN